jgi:hypothetical protein
VTFDGAYRLVCDRCRRLEASDGDLYGWTLLEGDMHVCAGCLIADEQALEEAAAERLKRLLREPSGVAILKMALRDAPMSGSLATDV